MPASMHMYEQIAICHRSITIQKTRANQNHDAVFQTQRHPTKLRESRLNNMLRTRDDPSLISPLCHKDCRTHLGDVVEERDAVELHGGNAVAAHHSLRHQSIHGAWRSSEHRSTFRDHDKLAKAS